jgi:tetratricopeptide (TPR) repeat protein
MSKKSKLVTSALILSITVVALAIIVVACRFVDSLHKDMQAAQNLPVQGVSRGKDQSLKPGELEANFDANANIADDALGSYRDHLSGSELLFQKGLDSMTAANFKEGVFCFTEVLRNIPVEAKDHKQWLAAGKSGDRKMYTAFAHQSRAMCYLALKNYEAAIADLSEAIALRPDYHVNYLNRGKAYLITGRKKLGEKDMAMARAIMAKQAAEN